MKKTGPRESRRFARPALRVRLTPERFTFPSRLYVKGTVMRKTFNYVTDEISACNFIVSTFGVTRKTAQKAIDVAVNRDEYIGRKFIVEAWDTSSEHFLTIITK